MLDAITGALGWSLGGIVAVLGALAAWTVDRRRQRAQGRTDERQDAIQKDVENAERIRDRADVARADTDKRPAVDRLRDDHPGSLRD